MPRAGIEPALSGPQPDVLPLYYRGENKINNILNCSLFPISKNKQEKLFFYLTFHLQKFLKLIFLNKYIYSCLIFIFKISNDKKEKQKILMDKREREG